MSTRNIIIYISVFLVCSVLIYFACSSFMYYRYNKNLIEASSKINIPVSRAYLDENTVVTLEHIEMISLEKSDVSSDVYIKFNDVVGLCIKEGKTIKEGQFFYKDFLTECNDDVDNE